VRGGGMGGRGGGWPWWGVKLKKKKKKKKTTKRHGVLGWVPQKEKPKGTSRKLVVGGRQDTFLFPRCELISLLPLSLLLPPHPLSFDSPSDKKKKKKKKKKKPPSKKNHHTKKHKPHPQKKREPLRKKKEKRKPIHPHYKNPKKNPQEKKKKKKKKGKKPPPTKKNTPFLALLSGAEWSLRRGIRSIPFYHFYQPCRKKKQHPAFYCGKEITESDRFIAFFALFDSSRGRGVTYRRCFYLLEGGRISIITSFEKWERRVGFLVFHFLYDLPEEGKKGRRGEKSRLGVRFFSLRRSNVNLFAEKGEKVKNGGRTSLTIPGR